MIKDNLYTDLEFEVFDDYAMGRSDENNIFVTIKSYSNDLIILTKSAYDAAVLNAGAFDYIPIFIAATPNGIYEYNLDVYQPKFEPYTSNNNITYDIVELKDIAGKQILEFYPEFSSQDEYLDALMSHAEPKMLDDGEMW
jgi:hypothetical protein